MDGVTYTIDSIPEEAKVIFDDIAVVEEELLALSKKVGIARVAKDAMIDRFRQYKDDFVIFEEPPAKTEPSKPKPRKHSTKKTTP